MGITGHFFSQKDRRRHCITLDACQMPTSHTASNVRRIVEEEFTEWGIPNSKISRWLAAFMSHFYAVEEDSKEDDVVGGIEDGE